MILFSKSQVKILHNKKIRLFLYLIILLSPFSSVFAQNITLKVQNQRIKNVIEQIEKKYKLEFFFNKDLKGLDKSVTYSFDNQPIHNVLAAIFKNSGISYQIKDGNVIVLTNGLQGVQNKPSNKKKVKISGVVIDATGEPIIGANVTQKGTTNGVITDIDGNFSLNMPLNDIISVSFIGYTAQNIRVNNINTLKIKLIEDTQNLEEVVVVGYGTQKKVNLTGSVASVNVDEKISNRSITSVANGLSGMMPGLSSIQNSGMAGNDNASLQIRGMGTVNNSNPLIVVDGMPDIDINNININDIESISVLKDATSSAVYGSRAANGVILVTTKTGANSQKTHLNFSSSYAMLKPTKATEFMDDYSRSLTLSQRRQMTETRREQTVFKDGTIDQWMAMGMIDSFRFPNTDWMDVITRTGSIQNYNISATGGGDKTNFFISCGLLKNKGLQLNNDYTRYNVRANYDYKLNHNMKIGVRVDGNTSEMVYSLENGFTNNGDANAGMDIQYAIAGMTPYDPVSGKWGGVMAYGEDTSAYNPLADLTLNLTHKERQEANGNIFLEWNVIKGLKARVSLSGTYYNQFIKKAFTPSGFAYNFQTDEETSRTYVPDNTPIYNGDMTGYKLQNSSQLEYKFDVAKNHKFSILGVYSEEYWHVRSLSAQRNDRIHPSLSEINAALEEYQKTSGTSSAEGLRSYIGRLNYNAYEKYLLEFNLRIDGSSKFSKGSQYGYFPSVALGWRFSEEEFVKKLLSDRLSNGKLRVSYGSLGNNSGVGRYDQQETMKNQKYIINDQVVTGLVSAKMINTSLSWETTKVFNLGVDLGFFNNRLTAELDYFDRLTTGMNRPSDISLLLSGLFTAPRANIGNLRNRGAEANLNWKDKISNVNYGINFNYSYTLSRLEKWNEQLQRGTTFIDMPYDFLYMYESAGIAQTWDDVYKATPQGAKPGDVLIKDLNGDGMIDDKDRKAYPNIQRNRPTQFFGFNLFASYKNFDISTLLQGSMGRKDFWLNIYNNTNFSEKRYATSWDHWTKPWNLENRGGELPRLGGSGNNRMASSFWLDDMSYVRMKNLQLGYSLPKKYTKKLNINKVRVFFSGENLFTITQFRGIDPEKSGNANDLYPLNKSYTLGFTFDI